MSNLQKNKEPKTEFDFIIKKGLKKFTIICLKYFINII